MWLVSGLLVLCTVLPFIILNKSGKGDLKIMNKEVARLRNDRKLKFSLKENWGNSFIGLDANNRKLVFSKVFDGVVALDNIDLNEVHNVKIVKKTLNKSSKLVLAVLSPERVKQVVIQTATVSYFLTILCCPF